MIAQFFQRSNVAQSGQTGLHLLFVENVFLDRVRCYETFVQQLLQFGHFHTDDHLKFDRQIFRQNLIRSSNETLIHDVCESGQTFRSFLTLAVRGTGILSPEDDVFVLLFEVLYTEWRRCGEFESEGVNFLGTVTSLTFLVPSSPGLTK